MTDDTKRVIIGAGPAGINVAVTLAQQGIKSIIIDENVHIGGAIFRKHDRKNVRLPFNLGWPYSMADELCRGFNQYKEYISFINNTEVLGLLDDDRTILLLRDGRVERLRADHFFICTGATEMMQPFPGWELPGVMGLGGLQLQVKSAYLKPANNAVLVGTGPLLLAVGKQLNQAGVNVQGIYEAARMKEIAKQGIMAGPSALIHNKRLLYEAMKYHLYFKFHRIPFRHAWGIVEARGDTCLEEVVVAPYDKNWFPIKEKQKVIKADALGVNYGFVCRIQLAYLFGCKNIFLKNDGGFQPQKDDWMQSSEENVFVAGDCAGFYGVEMAMLEGKIAATASMRNSGRLTSNEAHKKVSELNKRRRPLQSFHDILHTVCSPRPGLLALPNDDTLICRCENIPFGRAKKILDKNIIPTTTALKMNSRLGMGDCQGRVCGSFANRYMSSVNQDMTPLDVGMIRPRFPITHVPFTAFTQYDVELDAHVEEGKHHQGDMDDDAES